MQKEGKWIPIPKMMELNAGKDPLLVGRHIHWIIQDLITRSRIIQRVDVNLQLDFPEWDRFEFYWDVTDCDFHQIILKKRKRWKVEMAILVRCTIGF